MYNTDMMKAFLIVFSVMALVGLWKSLAVTLACLVMIPLILYARKRFDKMDAQWEIDHKPTPTEKVIEYHPCSYL
jgi:predicted cobalt transporter CbtA